ncbi:MAG TPA: hypothetical protein VN029_09735, partial [Sphingomonas sp.]|nr:hypothetical protein [Sphingomonas sp.]
MRGFGIKTRIVLVGVIVLILLGYAWWLFAPRKMAPPDAEIEVTEVYYGPVSRGDAELPGLPLFDPDSDGWIVADKRVRSVAGQVGPGPSEGQDLHGTGRALVVRLPNGAGKGVMR